MLEIICRVFFCGFKCVLKHDETGSALSSLPSSSLLAAAELVRTQPSPLMTLKQRN